MIVLLDTLKVPPSGVGLTDGAGSEVHDFVAVLRDISVELGHTEMRPVAANHGKDMAQRVRLGDRAVDVGNDDVVGMLPQVNAGGARNIS